MHVTYWMVHAVTVSSSFTWMSIIECIGYVGLVGVHEKLRCEMLSKQATSRFDKNMS